jgi:hypothetical protein
MDLTLFKKSFHVTDDMGNSVLPLGISKRVDGKFCYCLEELGGKIFSDGIYRVYRWDQIESKTNLIWRVFEATRNQVVIFAADWSGRQFGIDCAEQTNDGEPSVECFDVGAVKSFCTDNDILTFHNRILVEKSDAALAKPFFQCWKKLHPKPIPASKCVGYKTPLFLGGKDDLTNLELTDLDVYLEFCAQLWERVKSLPSGAGVDRISIGKSDARG